MFCFIIDFYRAIFIDYHVISWSDSKMVFTIEFIMKFHENKKKSMLLCKNHLCFALRSGYAADSAMEGPRSVPKVRGHPTKRSKSFFERNSWKSSETAKIARCPNLVRIRRRFGNGRSGVGAEGAGAPNETF